MAKTKKRKRSPGNNTYTSDSRPRRNTRANPAFQRHQFLNPSNSARDAGIVANSSYFPIADVMGSQGNSLWPVATSILKNLNVGDYKSLRSSTKGLSTSLPSIPQPGQQEPGPVKNLGLDCQNVFFRPPTYIGGVRHIPYPRPSIPYPAVPCTRRHMNESSSPRIRNCAGFQHGLPSAVGPNGHGRHLLVCEPCAKDSSDGYCLDTSLPQHAIEICAPCAGDLRTTHHPFFQSCVCEVHIRT